MNNGSDDDHVFDNDNDNKYFSINDYGLYVCIIYGHIGTHGHRTMCKQIWASEVSLERATKMKLSSAN